MQGFGALRRDIHRIAGLRKAVDSCYCVMGVACDLVSRNSWVPVGVRIDIDLESQRWTKYTFDGSQGGMSPRVLAWYGFDREDFRVGEFTLIQWNDVRCASFKEIAAALEKHVYPTRYGATKR